MKKLLLLSGLLSLCAVSSAATIVFDIDTIRSAGNLGDFGNYRTTVDVGANARIVSMSWDVSLTARNPSWLEDMVLTVGFPQTAYSFSINPARGDAFYGTGRYTGTIDLSQGSGLFAGQDGLLALEFWETYDDDLEGLIDGFWHDGTLTFETQAVPEPASMAALGLGGLALLRRRRKSA